MKKLVRVLSLLSLLLILTGCSEKDIYLSFETYNNQTIKEVKLTNKLVLPYPRKEGYEFDGWYTDKNYYVEFKKEDYLNVNEPNVTIKLYAKWNLIEYRIEYVLDGGLNDGSNPNSYHVDESIELKSPKKATFTFDGWYLNEGFSGDKVTEIPQGTTGHMKLYAKWVTLYKMIFDVNGGTLISSISQTTVGSFVDKPNDPTRFGYIFDGWYLSEENGNGTGEVVSWPYKPTKDTYVYAKWISVNTINFNSNNGTVVPNVSQTSIGGSISKPTDPTKLGYIFDGWYLSNDNENGTGELVSWPYTPTTNVTLYAKWIKVYSITFDSNGGTAIETLAQTSIGGSIPSPQDPTRVGHAFGGWYLSEYINNGTGELVTWPYTPTEDIVVYAKWTMVYTLNFDSNGGTYVQYLSQPTVGGSIAKPTDPTKEGYIFDGWYLSEKENNGSGELVTWPYTPTEHLVLYAKWTKASDLLGNSFSSAIEINSLNVPYLVNINLMGKEVYYKFIPTFTKEYTIISTGNSDPNATLYGAGAIHLADNDDANGTSNFEIKYVLNAGYTYYIVVGLFSTNATGSFNILIK